MEPKCLFIILVLSTALESSSSSNGDQHFSEKDYIKALNQTMHAIDRLLLFYEEEIEQVNLDAIFGLRVAEGAVALTQPNDSTKETRYIYGTLYKLKKRAASINKRAQASIKKQSESYYWKFKDVVDKPWSFFLDFGSRKLPAIKNWEIMSESNRTWDEETSDRCMSEALGSNPNHTKCMFTPVCVTALTDLDQVGYGPTHQILFLTVALINKCQLKYSKILKQHLGYGVHQLIENRCLRIMKEMVAFEKPRVKEPDRDVYMEQGFVCAVHGYEEFLSLKRLKNILSWQREFGCFGKMKQDDSSYDAEKMETVVGHRSGRNVGSFRSMRRLLVDVVVEHGCSAHESGVAAGLLGIYARWLLTKVDVGTEKLATTPYHVNTGIAIEGENYRSSNPIAKNQQHHLKNNKNNENNHKDYTISNHDNNNNNNNNSNNNNNNNNNDNSNNNNNNNNKDKSNITAKDIYIRSMVIAFVTSLLTVAVVLLLYEFGGSLCSGRSMSKRKYSPLIDA